MKIIYLIIVFLFVLSSCTNKKQQQVAVNKYDSTILSYKVYKVDSGWGYKIFKNKKVFIKQPIIPAINASVPFKKEEDAEKVAKFVIEKMEKLSGLPTVTPDELDSLGVLDSVLRKYK